MIDVVNFVRRAAEKCNFVRARSNEKNLPTDPANICIMPFFGDLRSLFVLSSLLLKRFKEEEKANKYLILCSWPGFQGLFPYVDEYWSLDSDLLYEGASQFRNKKGLDNYIRLFNQWFEDVVMPDVQFSKVYKHGIQDNFWEKYHDVKRFLPLVPSSASLGSFNRDLSMRGGFKVFVWPTPYMSSWRLGDVQNINISKAFWVSLVERLISERFVPVIYKGFLTYDLSVDFTDKCVYVAESDISKVMSAMRSVGCVLDVFNGVSRIALGARCPFISVDERARYSVLKEYEIDDLCGNFLPKQYIFSFSTIIEGGGPTSWNADLFDGIVSRLNRFLPSLDREQWPSTNESTEIVSYDNVRSKKLKKIGTKLLKIRSNEDG